MPSIKHLHIVGNELKFIKPFIKYINHNFNGEEHFFLILDSSKEDAVEMIGFDNVKIAKPYSSSNHIFRKMWLLYKIPKSFCLLFYYFFFSKKIYLHGIFDKKVILFLYIFRFFSSKVYWLMWGGGDLDVPTKQLSDTNWYKISEKVKGSFCGYVSYLPGDYTLAEKLYKVKGQYYESLMYESNTFVEIELQEKNDDVTRIQVGNSADCANNHFEIFESLLKYKNENVEIYCILSYGEKPWSVGWTKKVMNRGKELFGAKFIPVTEFMNYDSYIEFLGIIDIAIFAHKRQQAMGNTISLLGLGKKVYLRSDITSWELFNNLGVNVFDVKDVDISKLAEAEKVNNIRLIREHFSKEKYHLQLKTFFEDF
jgi:dTDP-N-acetylfucosamine:lipid II N-acetylfucosaminyltransferase